MLEAAQTVLRDPSVLNATAFCLAAFGGQGLHYIKKWAEGEDWVFANVRRTVGALASNVAGMLGFVSTGALDDMTKIGTVIALGAFMGFSADSAFNKGERKQWSEAERAVKKPEQ